MQSKLLELKEMYEKGLISKEVYDEQQRSVLSNQSAKQTESQSETKKVKSVSWLSKIGLAVLIIFGGIWLVHSISDQKGKDSVNEFVTATGIGKQVIPWEDRADTIVRKLIEKNKAAIAGSIQGISHPSGRDPILVNFSISKYPGRVDAVFNVKWYGGFLGNEYLTSVKWRFDKDGHIAAEIASDNANIGVAPENEKQLDNYFRTEIYPIFKSGLGD